MTRPRTRPHGTNIAVRAMMNGHNATIRLALATWQFRNFVAGSFSYQLGGPAICNIRSLVPPWCLPGASSRPPCGFSQLPAPLLGHRSRIEKRSVWAVWASPGRPWASPGVLSVVFRRLANVAVARVALHFLCLVTSQPPCSLLAAFSQVSAPSSRIARASKNVVPEHLGPLEVRHGS